MQPGSVLNFENQNVNRQLRHVAFALACMTVITFGLAIIAVPISGANVVGEGIPYPYMDTLGQFPRDFIWQLAAILQLMLFIWLFSIFPQAVENSHRHHADTAKTFALAAGIILITNYYLQFSVVPISLRAKELDGLPLLIQYNSHGIFIVLEEIGYILISISFVFLGQCFSGAQRRFVVLKWILRLPFLAGAILFVIVSFKTGLDRKDSFEIWIISFDWLALLIASIIIAGIFKPKSHTS